ncbi:AAA family ATPase [Tunturiibacter gelidiferens]|uniref:AAA family ATPase n=1 Tax=Tunturiibacter gelidiferens TaxID=3069689 RepID=UPI003D9B9630
MKLIFLYGLPATGKLSVAQELAAMTGHRLFHNHLTVDLLLSVFDFGSPAFVALREEIWLSVFDQASLSKLPALIFTFAPEPTVRPGFLERVMTTVAKRGGEVDFVELVCPLSELRRRLNTPSRLQYRKLTSATLFDQIHATGGFDGSFLPKPRLSIDTSLCTAAQAAAKIAEVLELDLSLT